MNIVVQYCWKMVADEEGGGVMTQFYHVDPEEMELS